MKRPLSRRAPSLRREATSVAEPAPLHGVRRHGVLRNHGTGAAAPVRKALRNAQRSQVAA